MLPQLHTILFVLPLTLSAPLNPIDSREASPQIPGFPQIPGIPKIPFPSIPGIPDLTKIPGFPTAIPTSLITNKIPTIPTAIPTNLPVKVPDVPVVDDRPVLPRADGLGASLPVKTEDLEGLLGSLLTGKPRTNPGISVREAAPQIPGIPSVPGVPGGGAGGLVGSIPIIGPILGGLPGLGGGKARRDAVRRDAQLGGIGGGDLLKGIPIIGGLLGGLGRREPEPGPQLTGVGPLPLGQLGTVTDTLGTVTKGLGELGLPVKRD